MLRDVDVLPGGIVSRLRLLPLHHVPLLSLCVTLWTLLFVAVGLSGDGGLRY